MKKNLIYTLLLTALLSACSTPKNITYMQDFENGQTRNVDVPKQLTIKPGDKLSIIVSCEDPELAEVFNLAVANYRIGVNTSATSFGTVQSSDSKVGSFSVNTEGDIEYPLLGQLHVAGMTRFEVSRLIKDKIISGDYLKKPIVTVDFANATVAVLGDVKTPGYYTIDRDDMTILQALSLAGDLNITGKRENVLVVRREGDKNIAYRVDLTNAEELMQSPAFYIQQNDAIYVDPNNTKKRQATANGNNALTTSFWISLVSVLTTIAVLVFK